jgi:hypothetical protein
MSITVAPTPTPMKRNKHKLLMQTTSGMLYPWNEQLAKRQDMVEYKHPTRDKVAKKEKKTPDEIKTEALKSRGIEPPTPPTTAEMAQMVLKHSKKSATQE